MYLSNHIDLNGNFIWKNTNSDQIGKRSGKKKVLEKYQLRVDI